MSLAAGFTVAAVVANVAAASTLCPEDAIKTLSTSDVQDLLVEWELDHAFGEEFLQQRVNGYTLQLLSPDTVVPAQYPKAQPFHWTVLWSRLLECKEDDKPQLPVNGDTAVPTNDRRRLGSVGDADAGIHIKRDSAAIALGVDGDILLRRLEARVLAMENDLYFCDGNSINFCNQNGGPSASVGSDGQGNILITGDLKFRQNATSNQVRVVNPACLFHIHHACVCFDFPPDSRCCSDHVVAASCVLLCERHHGLCQSELNCQDAVLL